MRVAFTVRIPEKLHKQFRIQATDKTLSLQDATESAIAHWIESSGPALAGHGSDCPLAAASKPESELVVSLLGLVRGSADLAAFLRGAVAGFKRFR